MKKKQSGFPLPEPMELAKLAAILRPTSEAKGALKTAMEFYLEAVLFSRELPSAVEELLTRFGSDERRRNVQVASLRGIQKIVAELGTDKVDEIGKTAAQDAIRERDGETVELFLSPATHQNPALGYLRRHGWEGRLKNPKTVLTNIRRYWPKITKYSMVPGSCAARNIVCARLVFRLSYCIIFLRNEAHVFPRSFSENAGRGDTATGLTKVNYNGPNNRRNAPNFTAQLDTIGPLRTVD